MLVISSLRPSWPGPDHFCPEQYNAVATFLFVWHYRQYTSQGPRRFYYVPKIHYICKKYRGRYNNKLLNNRTVRTGAQKNLEKGWLIDSAQDCCSAVQGSILHLPTCGGLSVLTVGGLSSAVLYERRQIKEKEEESPRTANLAFETTSRLLILAYFDKCGTKPHTFLMTLSL